jgi:hypothetical protein
MNPALIDQLRLIIRAISITSESAFSFGGKDFAPLDTARAQWPAAPAKNPLVAQLAQQLYDQAYCRQFSGQVDDLYSATPSTPNDILMELSAANAGREHWDAGWQVHRLMPTGQIIANKGGLMRLLWPGEFVSHEGPVAMRENARISVFAPRESMVIQPGFYFVFSETVSDQQDDYDLVRFYWHVKSEGAPLLVQLISREFNRFQIPFRFKSLATRAFYQRSDAAVLYVTRRFYRISVELLADIHQEVKTHLGPEPPLFSKRLADGLGLAEEPGAGESFGQSRTRILAEGIWNSYEKGLQSEQERLEEVRQHFSSNGLSLEAPFLNPGSIDEYDFPSIATTDQT